MKEILTSPRNPTLCVTLPLGLYCILLIVAGFNTYVVDSGLVSSSFLEVQDRTVSLRSSKEI